MNKRGFKIFLLVLLIPLFLSLTGCWNNRPLKTMGIDAAIGIDRVNGNQIEFSVQIVKPSALATEKGTKEKAFIFASNSADTLHSAGRNLFTLFLNKTIYIDHVQVIVISEDMAKHGITDALDFWERDFEANFHAIVIIAKGVDAKTVLQAESEMEPIPCMQIVKSIKNAKYTAEALESGLPGCISALNTQGFGLTVGMVQFKEGSNHKSLSDIDLRGAAVFKGDKLAGYIGPNDVKSLLIIKGKAKGGLFDITNPFDKNETFNYEMTEASTKMEVKFQNGNPQFSVNTKLAGGLSELHGKSPSLTKSTIKIFEDAAAKKIKATINKTIDTTKNEFDDDIFGFGQKLAREYPDYWEQAKGKWGEIYKTLPVKVEVEVSINEFGRINEGH